MRHSLKRGIACIMALSLMIPAMVAPESQAAAKKPTIKKKVSIAKGKSKTIKVTSKKKVKKTKWSLDKKGKKVVKLSKKKAKSVKVKALKKGKAKLTAKVKVGKKTYKLKSTITVTAAKGTDVGKKPSGSPSAAPGGNSSTKPSGSPSTKPSGSPSTAPSEVPATPTPTLRPLTSVAPVTVEKQSSDIFPTTPPDPTVDPNTKPAYVADFENEVVGTTSIDAISGAGIEGFVLRGYDPDDNALKYDYLEVVDSSTLKAADGGPLEEPNTHGKVLKCYRREKTWQGPMLPVVDKANGIPDKVEGGCTYTLEAEVYSPGTDMYCSYQLQAVKEVETGYGNFGPNSSSRYTFKKGQWNKMQVDITIPDDMYYYAIYFESVTAGGTTADIYIDNIKLTKKTAVAPDKSIPSLKDEYKDVFDIIGVGTGVDALFGSNGSEFIASQYNAMTPGNDMKPNAIMPGDFEEISLAEAKELGYIIPDDYTKYDDNRSRDGDKDFIVPKLNFTTVDNILKYCHEKGLKLRGHTLLWHQQTPYYFFQQNYRAIANKKYNTTKEVMDVRQEFFERSVLEHILTSPYGDCLYAYDVVNEYLHSKGAEKTPVGPGQGPTYWGLIYGTEDSAVKSGVTLRPSFVKKAFEIADDMLKKHNREDVKLFYNDYNCYQNPDDVVHLIDFINEDGKICDGLGMQSHLDITSTFHSADNYATALEFFRVNMPEVEIQVTELDAGMTSTQDNPLTDMDQAAYYDQIMRALIESKKKGGNITGLIIWSLYDAVSWRANNTPCIFKGLFAPKSAFYAVFDAKKRYWDK